MVASSYETELRKGQPQCDKVNMPYTTISDTHRGFGKGGFQKGGFGGCSPVAKTGTRVHSDVSLYQKQERGYIRMFP